MKFSIDTKKELTIFRLQEKRLDAAIAPELKSQIVLMVEAENKKYLIIDLTQVTAIDSSGIGSLLVAHRQTMAHDGFAAFIGVKGNVLDLLKMTNLDRQLYIFSSVQEVMRNLEAVEASDEKEKDSELDDDDAAEIALPDDIEELGDGDLPSDDLPLGDLDIPEFSDDDSMGEDGPKKKKGAKKGKAKASSSEKKSKAKSVEKKPTKKKK